MNLGGHIVTSVVSSLSVTDLVGFSLLMILNVLSWSWAYSLHC